MTVWKLCKSYIHSVHLYNLWTYYRAYTVHSYLWVRKESCSVGIFLSSGTLWAWRKIEVKLLFQVKWQYLPPQNCFPSIFSVISTKKKGNSWSTGDFLTVEENKLSLCGLLSSRFTFFLIQQQHERGFLVSFLTSRSNVLLSYASLQD